MAERSPFMIGIAGWSGSGKTTLIEKLIPALLARGLKVATVKHTHHSLRRGDPATDSARHARAGAVAVVVIGPAEWELDGKAQTSPPPRLEDAGKLLAAADVILVEGCKSASIPKIEVRRGTSEETLADRDPFVVAIASDQTVKAAVPVLSLDNAEAVAAFIAGCRPHS